MAGIHEFLGWRELISVPLMMCETRGIPRLVPLRVRSGGGRNQGAQPLRSKGPARIAEANAFNRRAGSACYAMGWAADITILDPDKVRPLMPTVDHDLPTGAVALEGEIARLARHDRSLADLRPREHNARESTGLYEVRGRS